MNHTLFKHCHWLALALLLAAPVAAAADDDEIIADDPNAGEEHIALPGDEAEEARANAAYGLKEANEARDKKRAYGEERAATAGGNADSGQRQ